MIFVLTKEQQVKLAKWQEKHNLEYGTGCIGGRYTFEFTPTSVGCIEICKDAITNSQIDLTDYENW